MTTIIYQLPGGERRTAKAKDGQSVMEVARYIDLPGIIAECGGSCSCATCHVYVEERFASSFAPIESFEEDMLEGVTAERRPTSRLSCQLIVTPAVEGMVVEIPERQL